MNLAPSVAISCTYRSSEVCSIWTSWKTYIGQLHSHFLEGSGKYGYWRSIFSTFPAAVREVFGFLRSMLEMVIKCCLSLGDLRLMERRWKQIELPSIGRDAQF